MKVLTPESVGLSPRPLDALRGGDPKDNARWLAALLAGEGEPAHAEAVAINAGALLWLGGVADDHRRGTELALSSIAAGKPAERLEKLREVSGGAG